MRPNKIKQMWRDGQCVTLGWLSVSHGFTAEVMARQGFDALCVDLQHGTAEMKDVAPMLQAISQTDTVPVVRVAWNEPAAIMKALDLGAYGIIVPLVNTPAEAAMAVAACRYPPVGMRSSGPVRAVHYGGADYVAHANDEIVRSKPQYAPALKLAIVHHTAGTNTYSRAQAPAIVRGIEVYHVEDSTGKAAGGPGVVGVIVQLGGQTPLGLARKLKKAGLPIVTTATSSTRARMMP